MTDQAHNPNELELWRRYQAAAAADTCPDELELAAYVDGEGDAERVAAHLAHCPACRQAVDETRQLISATPLLAPRHWLERAGTLPQPARRATTWRRAAQWAASAAAVAAIGLAGFAGGSATYRDRQAAEAGLLQALSFGLTNGSQDAPETWGGAEGGGQ